MHRNSKMKSELDGRFQEIRQYYDGVYYKNVKRQVVVSRHLKHLARKVLYGEENNILDVACGTGSWLLSAGTRSNASLAGIDISQVAIDTCRANLPNGEFSAGTAETLPFESNRFDLVSCLGSLEHFIDPAAALREMVRVAKQDARFLLLVPNSGFLTRRLKLFKGTDQVAAREIVRSLDEWQTLFEAAGLITTDRWKDLHVLSWNWISANNWAHIPLRAMQAVALMIWPLSWQYQVYHLCEKAATNAE